MTRCPEHYWFEYDETQGNCPLCERRAMEKVAATGEPIDVPPIARPGEAPDASAPPFAAEAAMAPAEPQPEPTPTPQQPWVGDSLLEPPPIVPEPFNNAPLIPEPRIEEPRQPEPEPEPEPLPVARSQFLAEVNRIREAGTPTIVLIGFYAGGKTWFLQRLKHRLSDVGYTVSPAPADDGTEVVRTFQPEIHHVHRRMPDRTVRSFAIVDIPGESLRQLVTGDLAASREIIGALQMCDAMIVALPSDEVLLAEDIRRSAAKAGGVEKVLVERLIDNKDMHPIALHAVDLVRKAGSVPDVLGPAPTLETALVEAKAKAAASPGDVELGQSIVSMEKDLEAIRLLDRMWRLYQAHEELTRFTQDLCYLTGMMSKLKTEGRIFDERYDLSELMPATINSHIASPHYKPFDRPTFVAMTKADLISHPDALLGALIDHGPHPEIGDSFDVDPFQTVQTMRPALANTFDQWLDTVKFDFVTAFHLHRGSLVIDYDKRFFGVEAVINWILWSTRWNRMKRGEKAALERAKQVRRRRDGSRELLKGDFEKKAAP